MSKKEQIKKDYKKNKRGEIAFTVLKTIGAIGLVAGVMVFPGLALIIQQFEKTTKLSSRQVRHSLYGMRKRNIVHLKKTPKGLSIILTPKGKRELLKLSLRDLTVEKINPWDGLWRIVMFDIPESLRSSRDLIRIHLKRLGFIQVHKSVFINPFPCLEAIKLLRNYYELPAGSLYIFESRVLEGETELIKIFHLKK